MTSTTLPCAVAALNRPEFKGFGLELGRRPVAPFAAMPTPPEAPADPPGAAEQSPEQAATAGIAAATSRREVGGPKGPEPTRFGDWERGGRCIDF
jgi:hypothetical protein